LKFISEHIIDQITTELESSDGEFERAVVRLEEEQPYLLAYLFNEEFEVLTVAEKDYLLFLSIALWRSIKKEVGTLRMVGENDIGEADEKNWEQLTTAAGKTFRDRLNSFFEITPQEDLLAFVEDSLTLDEEETTVTKEGREPMFIALKTIIDVLTHESATS